MTATPVRPATLWPDVVTAPHSPIKAAVARKLLRAATSRLPVRVQLLPEGPDGHLTWWGAGDENSPVMRLVRPSAFFARVGTGGLIGIGESYMAGDWEPGEGSGLVDVLTVFAAELPRLIPQPLQKLRRFAVHYQPKSEENTPDGARSNISRHYDLSNELFSTFLDETMTYSAAIFDQPSTGQPSTGQPSTGAGQKAPGWDDLGPAQMAKIERLLDACGVGPGSRVLEIGTGWGQLALQAAARGAQVHSITLSEEQLVLAQERVAAAGHADAVTIELCDYRAVEGRYDAVVSVEMIEAVGEKYWPAYFATIERVLAPGGSVGIQAITMPHDRMVASRQTYTWIHKYVFPGGLLPSVQAVSTVATAAGLEVVDDLAFGFGYAETLRLWRERFTDRAEEVSGLGFDAVFARMWTFYLAYCEAGFRSRYLDVHQFVLRRPATSRASGARA